jgi:acetoin utilization deacetylase AcuC-like enzyme
VELISHPAFGHLHPTGGHPESRERITVLHERFAFTPCSPALEADILRCHTAAQLGRIRAAPGRIDSDTFCTASTYEAALLAAGAAIEAVSRGGFALARPPGHHAGPDRAMGFCIFNSVAIAARFAQNVLGVGRIAILDWDVHHGNGTQAIFAGDPDVLVASLHQWPSYPGTGGPDDQGAGWLNIPLAAGTGDEGYLAAFEQAERAIDAFAPELLLVSAGFDAHRDDPLGELDLSCDLFAELARHARGLAPRVAAVLEGGYNLQTLPDLVGATVEGFDEGDAAGNASEADPTTLNGEAPG